MLGRKQSISNDQWLEAQLHIEDAVPRDAIEAKKKQTIKDIKQKTKGKKAAYCWSGGKDSIVLGHICEEGGIHESVLVVCDLEYPAFTDWIEQEKPEGLSIINTGQDLEWLKRHEDMLFPQQSDKAALWFHIIQHRGQDQYYRANDLDMILLGRRRADGNYVGRGNNIYTNNRGVTRFSPLSDWTHEELLAYIHYYELPMPPIYNWPNGYLCGTHPWPARQHTGSIMNGYKEVYSIDPSIVVEASEYLDSAKAFLDDCSR